MNSIVPPNAIVTRPTFGLANRLRAIASALAIAESRDLPCYIFWEPSIGFDRGSWSSFFTLQVNLLTREEWQSAYADPARFRAHDTTDNHLRGYSDLPDSLDLVTYWEREIQHKGLVWPMGFVDLVAVMRAGISQERHQELLARYQDQLEALAKSSPAYAIAEEYVRQNFAPNIIGIHVRRPDYEDTQVNNRRFLSSTDHHFFKFMDSQLIENSEQTFYLSTNSKAVLADYRQRYPDRIFSCTKTLPPDSETKYDREVFGDFVEMLILSQTDRVVGTSGSTFGSISAEIGRKRFNWVVNLVSVDD